MTFLVMQRILIENGLTPTIFENPNCIDVRPVREIMQDFKNGQAIYRKIVEESEDIKKQELKN